jgi:uncharacterized protein
MTDLPAPAGTIGVLRAAGGGRSRLQRAAHAVLALGLIALGCAHALAADAARGPDGLLPVPPLARVTDQAGVLSAGQRAALDARLADFEAQHGSQIAIILVDSVEPEPIEDYAHRVGATWKIGRAKIGDSVLFVAAIKDRRMRIDVAERLQGAIPDVMAGRLIRENVAPSFKTGDYAAGLNAALDGLFALILGEGLPPGPGDRSPASGSSGDGAIQTFVGFVAGGLFFGSLLRRVLGLFGALVAGGLTAAIMYFLLAAPVMAGVGGVLVFLLSAFSRSAGAFIPLPYGGGGGRGGFGGGGGGGGFSSGGGGNFSGGGASGSW